MKVIPLSKDKYIISAAQPRPDAASKTVLPFSLLWLGYVIGSAAVPEHKIVQGEAGVMLSAEPVQEQVGLSMVIRERD